MAAYSGSTSGAAGRAAGASAKNLGGLLAQLQLPARDLSRGQLLSGGQVGQRRLGFELGRVATVGAFGGHNRAKLARFFCPIFGEYYSLTPGC